MPISVNVALRAPQLAQRTGETLRMLVLGSRYEYTTSLAPLLTRKHALRLRPPRTTKIQLDLDLPPGFHWSQVPTDKAISSKFGAFRLVTTSTPEHAKVEMELRFIVADIAVADYSSYREFLRQVDVALAQSFEAVSAR